MKESYELKCHENAQVLPLIFVSATCLHIVLHEEYLDSLLSHLCLPKCPFILCNDYNCRIVLFCVDCIEGVDDVPERVPIDYETNQYFEYKLIIEK